MRVALSFPGCHRRGGVERIVHECARYLVGRGHDVDVYAEEWDEIAHGSIRYHQVPRLRTPWFAQGAAYYARCSKILERADYDILNTHGCVCPTGGVHWVQSIQRAWLETSRRFRPPLSWPNIRQRLNPLHPILLRLEEKHFRERRYRKIIATTPQIREELNQFYGVPTEDVVVIPNGFSPDEFNPERRMSLRTRARAELGLTPDHTVLLFVANELQRKGYETILKSMRKMNAPELRLVVIGRPNPAEVMEWAGRFGLADQVLACGSASEVAMYHAASDIFVLPTQYEAFCLAILEALGSGLPVVTTRVPGAQNAILPGVNGELVEVDEAEQLAATLEKLRDPSVRHAMSLRASPSVEAYHWGSVLRRYESVLAEFSTPVSKERSLVAC